MLQSQSLDRVFHALSDATRRAIVERLVAGPATVSELASPFAMTLSAIGQHIQLLEECGLVRTAKRGRVREVSLATEELARAERWFESHRARWEKRLNRLADVLGEDKDPHQDADLTTRKADR
jgi:DNA-binding transcriptional ArsR family regulator